MSNYILGLFESISVCESAGGPVFHNLLAPIFPAFVQSVPYLRRNGLSAIYDITLTYWYEENGAKCCQVPTIQNLLFTSGDSNKSWNVQICVRKSSTGLIPKRRHGLEKWLERAWIEKDIQIRRIQKSFNGNNYLRQHSKRSHRWKWFKKYLR